MLAFDATFLVDYLDGADETAVFLDAHADRAFFAPSLALFEVYRGAARTGGRDTVAAAAESLDWVEPLPLTDSAAREAAAIEAELLDIGTPVNLGDVLVGGICRSHGATVVTRDSDFERVEGLDVETY